MNGMLVLLQAVGSVLFLLSAAPQAGPSHPWPVQSKVGASWSPETRLGHEVRAPPQGPASICLWISMQD